MSSKHQPQSARLGAPPAPAFLTRTIGDVTYRLFQWPDRSLRLTEDVLFKEEGDRKYFKHREWNVSSVDGLKDKVSPELFKEIEQCLS